MILVDTSVWIDYFNGRETDQTKILDELNEDDVCITDIIFTEVLQGIREEKEYLKIKTILESFHCKSSKSILTYLEAAKIFRKCRSQGLTIRSTIDCIISSIALENNISLLTSDKDFKEIAKCTNLIVYDMLV
jgi:predicted nucleic acid-binding protein